MAILLLNASYEPLRVVSERDAVGYMLDQKVVPATDAVGARLRTPSTIFEVPSILRLKHYVNVPHRKAAWTRRGVLDRDAYTCIYCGATLGDIKKGRRLTRRDMELEHIKPVSRGGGNTWSNTACACHYCNQRKGNREPHEAGMRLLWEPKTPRTNYVVASGEVPKEWRIYLEM
jgi:5-methylcytosine-specific restriction endonuclease McrA